MAASDKIIIDALRRIVKNDPELRSFLRALRSRGVLEAIRRTVGVDEILEDDCCAPEEEDVEEEDNDGNDGTIDGERPDDGDTEKGMDGQYRQPDGTLLPWDEEACTPDESWVQGVYYTGSGLGLSGNYISKNAVYNAAPSEYPIGVGDPPPIGQKTALIDNVSTLGVQYCDGGSCAAANAAVTKYCLNPGDYDAEMCVLERPCLEDTGDWPSDGKCQEALINGQFVPHPKDPDCASKAPRDFQTMCQGSGPEEQCITYIPTADGGHMRITVDPTTRLPDSDSTTSYYDSDGKFRREESYRLRNVQSDAYSSDNVPGNWE